MTLQEYYNIIITKYENGEYKIKTKKGLDKPIISDKDFITYAHNYLIYEWLLDHKDDRWQNLIDFIAVPDGVNKKDCDIDFTQVDFQEFYTFLIKLKK